MKLYDRKVYSERLLTVAKRCTECNNLLVPTGYMYYYDEGVPTWCIEYWCPLDREIHRDATPNTDRIAEEIIKSLDYEECFEHVPTLHEVVRGLQGQEGYEECFEYVPPTLRWDRLVELLQSDIPIHREFAAFMLGKRSEPEAFDLLMQALDDEDERVRTTAAHSLGQLGDERAVDRLVKEMLDESSPIRAAAAGALMTLGNPKALVPFLSVVDRGQPHLLRSYAVMALTKTPDQRAVDALLTLVEDDDKRIRYSVTRGLFEQAKTFGVDTRPALRRVAAQDPVEQLREMAAKYLKELGELDSAR